MVYTVKNPGVGVATYYHSSSSGDKRGSTDNKYFDWLNDIRIDFYEEADYGIDWAGTGSGVDVETTFQATPSSGISFTRVNTNAESGNLREYRYNGHTSTWDFTEFRGAISVTTTVEEITSTGAGTAIDYGSTAARTKHTMQIVGNDNGGTFSSCTVGFEISLDGTNFDASFSLSLTSAGNDIAIIEINAVKVRYNVTEITVTGDADLDVIITST